MNQSTACTVGYIVIVTSSSKGSVYTDMYVYLIAVLFDGRSTCLSALICALSLLYCFIRVAACTDLCINILFHVPALVPCVTVL